MKIKLENLNLIENNVDLDKYIEFREHVKNHMEYPQWLGDFTKEDLNELTKTGAKIWLYYIGKEPVCSMMLIPSSKKDLDKFGIDFDSKIVVDYGPMMVNPKYVGNNLQYQMLLKEDEYCLENGYLYAIGTVHPDNVYSINNLLKDDFKFINQKQFTRGIRNIYLKELVKK